MRLDTYCFNSLRKWPGLLSILFLMALPSMALADTIHVVAPDGGESWYVGSTYTIQWTDDFSGYVNIQLIKGGGWNRTITSSTLADGSYSWTIPAGVASGNDYQIEIRSNSNTSVVDWSDFNFTITNNQSITVSQPNGGEVYYFGDTLPIRWSDNISDTVNIRLVRNESTYRTITTSTASDGSYNWTIPSDIISGGGYKIGVQSNADPDVIDWSDYSFSMLEPPYITVASPSSGNVWRVGTTHTISWSDNISENVRIDLYRGSTLDRTISSSTSSDGSYSWSVPTNLEQRTDYRIRIQSTSNSSLYDYSDYFTISNPQITISNPDGGESYDLGDAVSITWTDNISENVKILLLKDDVVISTITSSTASDGQYTWTIPASTAQSSSYKVCVMSVDDENVADWSNGYFEINASIQVVAPNGGESYTAGENLTVTWTSDFSDAVRIYLLLDDVDYEEIAPAASNTGTYTWTIPSDLPSASNYKVSVARASDLQVIDWSNFGFTIVAPAITISNPDGGESFDLGDEVSITWTDNISENVKILLLKDDVVISTITSSTASDGQYTWTIPASTAQSSTYKVCVMSVDDENVADWSNGYFEINASIQVVAPNGGESYTAGENLTVTWTSDFSDAVRIYLLKDELDYREIVPSATNTGSYTWVIPDDLPTASTYKVSVARASDLQVIDWSDFVFGIEGVDFRITTPNSGGVFDAGDTVDISWTAGVDGTVTLRLIRLGHVKSVLATNIPVGGSFQWQVPANHAGGDDYRVELVSDQYPDISDQSDVPFSISRAMSSQAADLVQYFSELKSLEQERVATGLFLGYPSSDYSVEIPNRLLPLYGNPDAPGIVGCDFGFSTSGQNTTAVDSLIALAQRGHLIAVSWHANNPWGIEFDSGNMVNTTADETNGLDADFQQFANDLLDGNVANGAVVAWNDEIAAIADQFERLRDNGIPVLWRPLHEMNGPWFWWCAHDGLSYKKVWAHMLEYFTETRGLDNLLWVYSPNETSPWAPFDPESYPGSSSVDMFGIDLYSPAFTDSPLATELRALDGSKPIGIAEYGADPQTAPPGYSYESLESSLARESVSDFVFCLVWGIPELTLPNGAAYFLDSEITIGWSEFPWNGGASGVGDEAPGAIPFCLHGAVPNPFNPMTIISYDLSEGARVDLSVYDVRGRTIAVLVAGEHQGPGPHEVVWRGLDRAGRQVSAGVYFYRIRAGAYTATKAMALVK